MCGICGFTGHRNDQKAVIERMMKSIEHRGPDSEGSFCGGEITLGFRRLSIMGICRLFLTERFMIIKNCGPN